MVWKHPLDKEEKNMQIDKVFENVKERTIRENENCSPIREKKQLWFLQMIS